LTSHVGSARKKVGRTGFAHLFEHLLFFRIRKFGKGGLDKMSARIGGEGANGSTSEIERIIFRLFPKMLWKK
jgi:zinc protease